MLTSPKSVTRFYCGNNPVNWVDPWGLCDDKYTTPSGEYICTPPGYDPMRTVYEMQTTNPIGWYIEVDHGGERDFKTHGHTGNNEITHPEWEDVGNFDYGVSGSALGLPPWVLHLGARFAAGGPDEERDALMIDQGIEWYNQNADNLDSFDWYNDTDWEY